MKKLDFIVIGAQKSATTSLFRYLKQHPSISMPADKEAPFFSDDSFYEVGWKEFAKSRFVGAPADNLWGTVTPQYMYDERAAARIAHDMPDVKLVALLRNPVDRAHSHYRMAVRRGTEARSFSQAVDELCKADGKARASERLDSGTTPDAENSFYLEWGRYGSILKSYRRHFRDDQILVLYMDELQDDPGATVRKTLEFIGVSTDFTPDNLGKVYHRGGTRRIIPETWKHFIRDLPLFRPLWHCVPDRVRSVINYRYEQLNVVKERSDGVDPKTRSRLIEYYRSDVRVLQEHFTRQVPWPEFSESRPGGYQS